MTGKKQTVGKQIPVHTVRCGQVTAAVYLRQSNAGYAYCEFALTRSWKTMATGKESQGSTFFAEHEKDLVQAIHEASEWLRAKIHAASAVGVPDEQPSNTQ